MILRIIGGIIGLVLLIFIVYLLYLFFTYHRIEDMQQVEVMQNEEVTSGGKLPIGKDLKAVTYNIGFGAYAPEFTFFMDGGESGKADSKESVLRLTQGAADYVKEMDPDFVVFQEMDINSTRSFHVNQREMIEKTLTGYDSAHAINYDSAYLFYPFHEPIGKSLSGVDTLSRYRITNTIRRSLPVSHELKRFLDLDRCYTVSEIPCENGKSLFLYNVHLSAYGNDASVREGQTTMLCEDMSEKYAEGNYVVCGGDFNHDLKALDPEHVSEMEWAQPFPRERLPEGFQFCIDMFTEEEREAMPDTSRNTDVPYMEGKSLTVTLDGFLISDNVEMVFYKSCYNGFQNSDHDPVLLTFKLK